MLCGLYLEILFFFNLKIIDHFVFECVLALSVMGQWSLPPGAWRLCSHVVVPPPSQGFSVACSSSFWHFPSPRPPGLPPSNQVIICHPCPPAPLGRVGGIQKPGGTRGSLLGSVLRLPACSHKEPDIKQQVQNTMTGPEKRKISPSLYL